MTARLEKRKAEYAIERDPRWEAVLRRDAGGGGAFLYSVRTTGVYCRPSCAARRPGLKNVRFHDTPADAERAGFRPCKRCKPDRTMEIRFAAGRCSLGAVLVAASAAGVCAILLGDAPEPLVEDLAARFPRARLVAGDRMFEALRDRVIAFIESPARGLDLSLDVRGTAFQRRVWEALGAIPPGSTASYAEIAARIGASGSARAVARACGANPLAVAVPCHRVVREDGAPSGYRWGVRRKRSLLERERAA